MREFTGRTAAVRSIKALDTMINRCDELQRDWADIDYSMQEEIYRLTDRIREVKATIVEVYPGRASTTKEHEQ